MESNDPHLEYMRIIGLYKDYISSIYKSLSTYEFMDKMGLLDYNPY
jgi:hypothetical protein